MSLVIGEHVCENMSEGLHNVTITKVEDLGLQETPSGTKDCAAIYFTADDQKRGRPIEVRMKVMQSLDHGSKLAKLLTQLNVPFGDTFDLNVLVGISCQVLIQHKGKEGKIHANIAAVLKLSKRGILSHAETPCVA